MIFITDFFMVNSLPHSLNGVAELMRKTNNVVLLEDSHLDRLMELLADRLNKDRRANSTAYLDLHRSHNGKGGSIFLYRKKYDDSSVVRLYWKKIKEVLEYDEVVCDFFAVGDETFRFSGERRAL